MRRPQRRTLAWTLALAVTCSGAAEAQSDGVFRDVAAEVGLDFVHDAAVGGDYFMPESIGSGGVLFDYDGDGDLDVYLVNGAHRTGRDSGGAPLTNRMFRQESGFRFVDATAESGVCSKRAR